MICSKCKQNKRPSEFYNRPDRKNKKHSYCKKCFNLYCIRRWIEKKKKAVEYKGGKCVDCKGTFEYFLYDFHHINPATKEFQWDKLRLYGWNRMKKELDKCVLLCCMCHRRREQKW
jgi:hypothetical protein